MLKYDGCIQFPVADLCVQKASRVILNKSTTALTKEISVTTALIHKLRLNYKYSSHLQRPNSQALASKE